MAATRGSASAKMTLTLPSDREIVLTRVFDAPRRLVFEALTKPEHVGLRLGRGPRRMLRSGMEKGVAETYDRLAEHLGSMAERGG